MIDALLQAAVPERTPLASLSARERQVLRLVVEGACSAEIGRRASPSRHHGASQAIRSWLGLPAFSSGNRSGPG